MSADKDPLFEAQLLREQADEYAAKARWCFEHGYTSRGRSWRDLAVKYLRMADEGEAA